VRYRTHWIGCFYIVTWSHITLTGVQALSLASWVEGSDFCAMRDMKTCRSFIGLIDISN
jgi:hypothetical protein